MDEATLVHTGLVGAVDLLPRSGGEVFGSEVLQPQEAPDGDAE
jgi:hypothetical protein